MQQVLSSSVNQTFRCPHPGAQTSRQIIDGVDDSSTDPHMPSLPPFGNW